MSGGAPKGPRMATLEKWNKTREKKDPEFKEQQNQSPAALRTTAPSYPATQTKIDCVITSARGLTAPKIAEATRLDWVLVPHNLSLFTTSRKMRAMISRV